MSARPVRGFDPWGRFPTVTVVLPVRSAEADLEMLLGVLGRQRYGGTWEVVVATDHLQDVDAGRLELMFAGTVRHVRVAAGATVADLRNRAVMSARGEVLAFCDADVVPGVDWLTHLVGALRRADIVGGLVSDHHLASSGLGGLGRRPGAGPRSLPHVGILPGWLSAHNLAMPTDLFIGLGGFDPLLTPAEDVDLCWTAHARDYTMGLAPAAVVYARPASPHDILAEIASFGRGFARAYLKHRRSLPRMTQRQFNLLLDRELIDTGPSGEGRSGEGLDLGRATTFVDACRAEMDAHGMGTDARTAGGLGRRDLSASEREFGNTY